MTTQELTERYLNFMEEYVVSLPATLSDEERNARLMQALDELVVRDMDQLLEDADTQVAHAFDDLMVESEKAHEGNATEQQLAAVRQNL